MQSKDLYPYMHSVEALVKKGLQIPLALYEKDQLAAALQSAKEWKLGAAEMFLKKVTFYFLLYFQKIFRVKIDCNGLLL